eukprot:m.17445 g.17445  ORF g.17445 m.17445 type:complete len:50 (-) comp11228_c0_seq4:69-218(-)
MNWSSSPPPNVNTLSAAAMMDNSLLDCLHQGAPLHSIHFTGQTACTFGT